MGHMDIEQRRREFMREQPDLYEYICAYAVERELDVLGDTVSGAADGHGAANRLWRRSAMFRRRREELMGRTQGE